MSSRLSIYLSKCGIHLLQPYPHMARTILGSGLASLLAAVVLSIVYISYQVISTTSCIPQASKITAIEYPEKILPKQKIQRGQSYRESFLHTALPYQEKITASLSNRVRQADFALMQTLIRLDIHKDRIYPLIKKYCYNKDEVYCFQQIKIFLPNSIEWFVTNLQENLEAWAEKITLTASSKNTYKLSTDGIDTHELIFIPPGGKFIYCPIDEKPRITVIIDDIGESIETAKQLLNLEFPITLSILPHANYAESIAKLTHNAGQEVLIHQPMEAMQSPYVSAGPGEINTKMSSEEISKILYTNIDKVPYASGLNNHMGSRFTCNEKGNHTVCEVLALKGLFALDSMTHPLSLFYTIAKTKGLPAYYRTNFIDHGHHSNSSILNQLKKAEQHATKTGHAIVIGHPYPETISALKKWASLRDTSIHIVPLRYQPIHIETVKSDYPLKDNF